MTDTLDRETALLSLYSISHGSLKDLEVVLRALINGDLTETDITELLEVENPPTSEVLFREDGVGKVMSWADFLEALAAELGSSQPQPVAGTYFFDAVGGSDANNGRSAATAFQTIERFNSKSFLPGDVISFKRGQSHTGAMVLPSSGTAAAPIIINAYGSGAAPVISSGDDSGFISVDKSHFTIDGIEFAGARDPLVQGDDVVPNSVDGIRIENAQDGDTALAGIRVQNCKVSHYGGHGISLIGTNGASGFAAPLIDNCEVFSCTHFLNDGSRQAGIRVSADDNFGANANGYAHDDVIIRGSIVHDCTGTPGDADRSGSGIDIGQVDGAIITGNIVYNNGVLSAFPTGPYGIRIEDSNDVLVDHNESYGNTSISTVVDGGGIGILGGCTNVTVEKNFIHGNRGSGIVCYASATADLKAWATNTARFNVLEDNDIGEFVLGGSIAVIADANMIGVSVHNNTVYQRGGSARNCLLLASTTGVLITDFEGYIANNIIVSLNGAALIRAVSINPTFLRLRGNDYYAASTFLIAWNEVNYATYAAWQAVASTQEKVSAVNVGQIVNPLLTNPATDGVINADNSLLTGYKLQSISPMRTTGLDLLGEFTIDPGSSDYFGTTIGVTFNVGASYAIKDAPLTISGNPTLTGLTLNAYANWTATAAGGTGAYSYSLVGIWPSGITVHATTGVVSGTPLSTGAFTNLSIRALDTGTSETVDLSPLFTITVASGVPTYTVAPIIAPDSVYGGYAGSVWTCTSANWSVGTPTHQWYADGVAIGGATAATYTMTLANEGKVISCRQTNGGVVAVSNSIELWTPYDDAGVQPVALFDVRQGLTLTGALVDSWASTVGGVTATGTTTGRPTYSATALNGKPGITFDAASTNILTGIAISTVPTARTIVAVGMWAAYGTSQYFLNSSINNGYAFRRNTNSGQVEIQAKGIAVRAASDVSVAPIGTPKVASSRFSTTPTNAYNFHGGGFARGSGTPTGGFSGSGTQTIGDLTTGSLGTMAIFNSVLADDFYFRLIGWVAWTSGLSSMLIAGTPYKTAAPRATTIVATVVAVTVPEGFDNEAIIASIPTTVVSPTYTITARGEGMSIVGDDLIISDKVAFFAQAAPTISITATKAASSDQLFTINCTVVPGYFDMGLLGENVGMWWDMADNRTHYVDERDTFLVEVKDKSSFDRHMINPWFLDRRQRLGNPSTLKAGLPAFRNIRFTPTGKSTYGLCNQETPIWHGIRSVQLTDTSVIMLAAKAPNNNDKTIFSGLPSLLGRNVNMVIICDEATCQLRIDGVLVQTKNAGAGYFPPTEPCIIGFEARFISTGFMLSPSHLAQHPWWEGGDFNGDITEFFQLFNVRAVA